MSLPLKPPLAPQLARPRAELPVGEQWAYEPKYDGFRALCYLAQGRCRLISRNGNLMSRFVGLGDRIAASLDVGDAIEDLLGDWNE